MLLKWGYDFKHLPSVILSIFSFERCFTSLALIRTHYGVATKDYNLTKGLKLPLQNVNYNIYKRLINFKRGIDVIFLNRQNH